MDQRLNPYTPGPGIKPLKLAGRDGDFWPSSRVKRSGRGAFTERAGGSRSDWRAILRRSRGDDCVDLSLGSVERFWNEPESFSAGSRVQAAIPGGEEKILPGERESGGEMQGVQAVQPTVDRELGRPFDQALVHLDHAERGPLLAYGLGGCFACAQADGADALHEADTTHEPPVGAFHRVADDVAAGLSDVALDQRARVEVEVQRSASRSESTSDDALSRVLTSRGARLGRARVGATNRPSATSLRRRWSSAEAPAGTMSAIA